MDDYFELARRLVGKTVAGINRVEDAEAGLEIVFGDGSRLRFGYNDPMEASIIVELAEESNDAQS